MSLLLRGLSLNDIAMSRPLVGRFDERGGKIGRSDNVTFTLPDPERMISRVQAEIHFSADTYWIENVSAASPIFHNGRPLSAGMRVPLHDNDEIRIGGYTLQVAFEDDLTSATILRGRTDPIAPAPVAAPAAAQEEPARAEAAPAADANALWRGFLEGAGVTVALTGPPSPELMGTIGAMMKIAVEGIHRLISMRTVAKSEMHAEMTMIQMRGNNPLKFAPDAVAALQLLLQPPARGFLAGPAALRDAMVDLQSHQRGVNAGMRAALEAVLDRFDPVELETQLSARSVFDSLVPAHRRARLWELYLEHYRAMREEAQEDFHRLFGEAFLRAYDEQVRSLEAGAAADAAQGRKLGEPWR